MYDDAAVLDAPDANSALQTARDNYLASAVMTAESEHNGFVVFHPVGFPRKMDIKRKVDKYGAVCDDGDNMDVADHISDARKNGFNIIVMGWGASDPDVDPSFLYHYGVLTRSISPTSCRKASSQWRSTRIQASHATRNLTFAARGRSVDAVAFLGGWWDSVCVVR